MGRKNIFDVREKVISTITGKRGEAVTSGMSVPTHMERIYEPRCSTFMNLCH